MADSPGSMADDERPIALRKTRRILAGSYSHQHNNCASTVLRPHGISTPPATPKRSKKRVRFSDPGQMIESPQSASSGLTPFIRRTTLSTPQSKRHHSSPARLWNLAPTGTPISGILQFEPLRQVLDGRVKRRLKRHRLSEEINTIEEHKRIEAKARTELENLREALRTKDLEIQAMRDEQDLASQIGGESGTVLAASNSLGNKVQELEQQILELKEELARKEVDAIEDPDWTMAARDPFHLEEYQDDMMITNYSHDFRESMMDDEMMTTPTRLRISFPSPPTSMPNTPCKASSVHSAGIQTSLPIPDPEKDSLRSQLESFEIEISKLNSTIAFSTDVSSRLQAKLSDFIPDKEEQDHTSLDLALDTVLTQLALSQANALEKDYAFSALSSDVTSLGFSSCSGPEQVLEKIAAQFRQARLDLEYMTPGEVIEGFENEKLLDMLVGRMQVLVERVKEGDDNIDEYHDQELLLRQQLNTRIDAQQHLQEVLDSTKATVSDLVGTLEENETSNARLQKALDGYRHEVEGLEALILRMEEDSRSSEAVLKGEVDKIASRLQDEVLEHDTSRAIQEGNQILIMELERRLTAALQASADIEAQLVAITSSNTVAIAEKDAAIAEKDTTIAEKDAAFEQLKCSSLERERQHGDSLANRDALVLKIRTELERSNEALTTVVSLRKENAALKAQIESAKTFGQIVEESMRDQRNVLEKGVGNDNGNIRLLFGSRPASQVPNVSHLRYRREGSAPAAMSIDTLPKAPIVKRGGLFDANLARRRSKKRRRYDSGLGYLEDESEGMASS